MRLPETELSFHFLTGSGGVRAQRETGLCEAVHPEQPRTMINGRVKMSHTGSWGGGEGGVFPIASTKYFSHNSAPGEIFLVLGIHRWCVSWGKSKDQTFRGFGFPCVYGVVQMGAAEKLESWSSPPKNQGPGTATETTPIRNATRGKDEWNAAQCSEADGPLQLTCLALPNRDRAMIAIWCHAFST